MAERAGQALPAHMSRRRGTAAPQPWLLLDPPPPAPLPAPLPSSYRLTEGCQLWEGVRLGKFLGAGAQVSCAC